MTDAAINRALFEALERGGPAADEAVRAVNDFTRQRLREEARSNAEPFDTSMIGPMLRDVRGDTLIDTVIDPEPLRYDQIQIEDLLASDVIVQTQTRQAAVTIHIGRLAGPTERVNAFRETVSDVMTPRPELQVGMWVYYNVVLSQVLRSISTNGMTICQGLILMGGPSTRREEPDHVDLLNWGLDQHN